MKRNKILTSLLTLSILLSVFVLPAAAETVSVGSPTVAPGGTTTVSIQVTGITTDIAAATVRLTFNPAVVTVQSVGAGALGGPTTNINNAAGTVDISVFSTTPATTAPVTIASVVLQGVAGAAAGATSALTLTVTALADSNGVNRVPTITSGTATIGAAAQVLRIIDEKTAEGAAALAAGPQWDAQSFQGFWYDLDDGLSSETLKIVQTTLGDEKTAGKTRTIRDKDDPAGAGLIYQTDRQLVQFEVNENKALTVENSLNAAGTKIAAGTHYGKLGWMAEEFVAVNGKAKKLAKLLIEQEEATAEKKTLTVGESWQIGDWTLTANSIDAKADPRQAWLTLSYKGTKVDDKVVRQGEVYTYIEKSIAGESDVPMFVTLIDSVFAGATTDMVQFRFTWAISRDVTEVKSGDTVGVFEIVDAGEVTLKLENDASIDLSTDSTVTLARNFVFKVADDADFLRFMPDVLITEAGTYEDRGYVLDENARPAELAAGFTWDAQSFKGFWYELDDGLKSETLKIVQTTLGDEKTAGKTRTIRDKDDPAGAGLIYQTDRQLVQFEVNENKALTVENSLNAAGTKIAAGTHYGKLGWMAEEFVAVNGKAKKLAKLLIEQEEATAEKKTLTVGESWQIGDWTLTANSIDAKADPRQAWLTLSYKGTKVDDKVVRQGEVYTYIEKSIAGESDVPMFVTLIDSVFAGATTDMVQFRFTWAISRDVTEVKSGDTVGVFEIVDAGEVTLKLENDASIDLSTDSTVTLARSFNFKVADDADFLRFYPMVVRTVTAEGVVVPATPVTTAVTTPAVTTPAKTPAVNVTTPAMTPVMTPEVTTPAMTTPVATTPKEPGFEAVFAIAGLLAVAYLVLRRK